MSSPRYRNLYGLRNDGRWDSGLHDPTDAC